MKNRVSMRFLVFAATALFLLVVFGIFFYFNFRFGESAYLIRLPAQMDGTNSEVFGNSVAGIELQDTNALLVPDDALPMLIRAIPQDRAYQIQGTYTKDGVSCYIRIFFRDGKCKVIRDVDTKEETHTLILSDRCYTWRTGDTVYEEFVTLSPLVDSGYGFLDLDVLREAEDIRPAVKYSAFSLSSLSFQYDDLVSHMNYTYSISSENGSVLYYAASRAGNVRESFAISTIILGYPSEAVFLLPGEA